MRHGGCSVGEFLGDAWERLVASDVLLSVVITATLSFLAFVFNRWLSPKTKLRYGIYQDTVLRPLKSDGSRSLLFVRQIYVQNMGSKAAEDVEIIFNWQPPHIEQYPHLASTDELKADHRYIVRVPRLNGREGFMMSLVSETNELPSVTYVRGKDATAKIINYRTVVWVPLILRVFIGWLMALGFLGTVYLVVILLGWVFFGRVPMGV